MKICIVLLALASVALARPHYDTPAYNKCVADHGISQSTIVDFFRNYEAYKNDDNLKCFLTCVLENESIIDGQGDFQEEEYQKYAKDNLGEFTGINQQEIFECIVKNSVGDKCNKGYEMFKCFHARVLNKDAHSVDA